MVNNKKTVLFVGFTYDYEHIDINSIKEKYNVYSFYIPNRVNFFLSKMVITRKLYIKVMTMLLKLKVSNIIQHSGCVDILVTKDNFDYLDAIKKINIANKIFIFRNPVREIFLPYLKDYKSYTFDSDNAVIFNLNKYQQYTPAVDISKSLSVDTKFDLSFIGRDKGRGTLVKNITNLIKSDASYIRIIRDKNLFGKLISNLLPYFSDSLSYLSYLEKSIEAKAILDIVQEGQKGESMRFIEAMTFKRKLISNNQSLRSHELYNENNVLIFNTIEELTKDKIDKFLGIDFDEIVLQDIEKYSSFSVLSRIIEDNVTVECSINKV